MTWDAPVQDDAAERDGATDAASTTRRPGRARSALVHVSLVAFAVAILARAVQVQLVDGAEWAQRAAQQQVLDTTVVPPRGRILDATGGVLAETRELVRLNVVPRNVRVARDGKGTPADPRGALRTALRGLGYDAAQTRRALDTTRKWVQLPGLHLPSDVREVLALPGVVPTRVLSRVLVAPVGIRRVVGGVDQDQEPVGGIELELDSLLRGQWGRRQGVRDGRGGVFETPALSGVDARPGHTVTLTFNQSLQDIAERELLAALQATGARGGDVVMVDPRDGAVLALAGARDGALAAQSTPLIEPYEPGSVMKPFVIAHLLDAGRATADEVIDTENGDWMQGRRRLRDEHRARAMPVRDVVRFSSNIGTAKLAHRVPPGEVYEALRDFGFGALTGVPFPAESRGRLPLPSRWTAETQTSVSIGYEVSATPLQLANAYAAIANGGELLQPAFVREVRDPDGRVVFQHQRRVVRRVLGRDAALEMRAILQSVVDSGTARRAELKTYDVAGKSGTSRISAGGRYLDGKYNATFAGMFPAQDPQLVIVARLIEPKGQIFGGLVAAPLVNRVLQGAVATRDAALDREALAAVAKPVPLVATSRSGPRGTPRTADEERGRRPGGEIASDAAERSDEAGPSVELRRATDEPAVPSRVVLALPTDIGRGPDPAQRLEVASRPVPDVRGLDVRRAVRRLHEAGFEVRLAEGATGRTRPSAGTLARPGAVVVLEQPR